MTIWFPGLSGFWPVFDGFSVSANLKTPKPPNHIILFKVISVVDKDFYQAFPVFTDKFQVCRVSGFQKLSYSEVIGILDIGIQP